MSDPTLLLRALRLNAIFSASSALMLLLGGPWIAAQLGLAGVIPVYVTAGLLVATEQAGVNPVWGGFAPGNAYRWDASAILYTGHEVQWELLVAWLESKGA